MPAHPGTYRRYDRRHGLLIRLVRIDHLECVLIGIIACTDTNLDGAGRIDKTLPGRPIEHTAVVILFLLGVSVRVGVEVNQCQLAMGAGGATQQRQGHKMIPPQGKQGFTCSANTPRMLFHPGEHILGVPRRELQVAVVGHTQPVRE